MAARSGDLIAHIKTYLALYLAGFGLMLLAFIYLSKVAHFPLKLVLGFALLLRAIMVFSPPTLSDDINRYVWDGRLTSHGVNPYLYRPDAPELIQFRDSEIYPKMSSGFVYSIYPPVSQLVFFLGAQTSNPIRAIKAIYAAFDFGIVIILWLLLKQLGLPKRNLLLYAWNPLPVFEFAGSGHSDAAMLFFVLLAIYYLARGKYFWTYSSLGLAIISKLLPLIFLPFFLIATRGRRRLLWVGWTGLIVFLGYVPFVRALPTMVRNFLTSGQMYFNYYIFNGSLFTFGYWCRDEFHLYQRYMELDFMAQTLSFVFLGVLISLLCHAWLTRNQASPLWLGNHILLIFFAFLLCSANVQVWYINWTACLAPLFINLEGKSLGMSRLHRLARGNLSWLSWSLTVCFAYIAYYRLETRTGSYTVPTWAIWLEYGTLFGLLGVELIWRKGRVSTPAIS